MAKVYVNSHITLFIVFLYVLVNCKLSTYSEEVGQMPIGEKIIQVSTNIH